jgi:hypothetical protein
MVREGGFLDHEKYESGEWGTGKGNVANVIVLPLPMLPFINSGGGQR